MCFRKEGKRLPIYPVSTGTSRIVSVNNGFSKNSLKFANPAIFIYPFLYTNLIAAPTAVLKAAVQPTRRLSYTAPCTRTCPAVTSGFLPLSSTVNLILSSRITGSLFPVGKALAVSLYGSYLPVVLSFTRQVPSSTKPPVSNLEPSSVIPFTTYA